MAPSFSPAALPAVTRPCGRNGVLSPASASQRWCPGRGGSSAVARPQPSSVLRVATVTSDSWITPSAYACWHPLLAEHRERVGALPGDRREPVVQVLRGRRPSPAPTGRPASRPRSAGWGRCPGPSDGGPCARPRRRRPRRTRRTAMPEATVVTAVIAPGAHPVDREAGHRAGQPGQQRGGPADGQALVAGLGGGGDGHLVDPLRRQLGVAADQLTDAVDHQVVGAGLGVERPGLAERGTDAVDEDDIADLTRTWPVYYSRVTSSRHHRVIGQQRRDGGDGELPLPRPGPVVRRAPRPPPPRSPASAAARPAGGRSPG